MLQKIVDPKYNIKTFNVKSEKPISNLSKRILQSFKLKLYFCVIDDLFYLLNNNKHERQYFLQILYWSAIFLHNNLYVNFFDIYVYEIIIKEIKILNKFADKESNRFQISNQIIIKLAYQVKSVPKKIENNW